MSEKNVFETEKKIPFIQKMVFWLAGLSYPFAVLVIYFLFGDNKKYNKQINIMKNGAVVDFYLFFLWLILIVIRSTLKYFVNFI